MENIISSFNNYLMNTGVVKFYNSTKGFGFIVNNSTGEEIFVHVSGLIDNTIKEGDAVTFGIEDGRKGPNAVNVKLA